MSPDSIERGVISKIHVDPMTPKDGRHEIVLDPIVLGDTEQAMSKFAILRR